MTWPAISVVMPTLNAERYLDECLGALRAQEYAGRVEVLIADAGSTDRTLEIAAAHDVDHVLPNPLKSGEAGKAVGVRAATGDLVLLLDSDNIVLGEDWLTRMARPFVEDPEVFGCEPARFEARPQDHFINRWHALLGAADPLTIHTGNYARDSALTGRWTDYAHGEVAHDGWWRIDLFPEAVPVLGANGFLVRRSVYDLVPVGDYLFDLDHVRELVVRGYRTFARADVGVRHYFCNGVRRFQRKTRRRVDDFFFFQQEGARSYPWTAPDQTRGIASFALSTALVVPVVAEAMRGHARAPDAGAWAWHVLASWITLGTYAAGVVRGKLRPRMLDRSGWSQ